MFILKNENGLTLIEVLASIVLLSVVIISFLSLFPQITSFNKSTEENLQAAAVAKEVRVKMQRENLDINSPILTSFLENQNMEITSTSIIFQGSYNQFPVEITIWKNKQDVSGEIEDLYQMKVSIQNDNNQETSYTYGYISNKK